MADILNIQTAVIGALTGQVWQVIAAALVIAGAVITRHLITR